MASTNHYTSSDNDNSTRTYDSTDGELSDAGSEVTYSPAVLGGKKSKGFSKKKAVLVGLVVVGGLLFATGLAYHQSALCFAPAPAPAHQPIFQNGKLNVAELQDRVAENVEHFQERAEQANEYVQEAVAERYEEMEESMEESSGVCKKFFRSPEDGSVDKVKVAGVTVAGGVCIGFTYCGCKKLYQRCFGPQPEDPPVIESEEQGSEEEESGEQEYESDSAENEDSTSEESDEQQEPEVVEEPVVYTGPQEEDLSSFEVTDIENRFFTTLTGRGISDKKAREVAHNLSQVEAGSGKTAQEANVVKSMNQIAAMTDAELFAAIEGGPDGENAGEEGPQE